MPLPGDPTALLVAAEEMNAAARRLRDAHEALLAHGRTTTASWNGTAAPLALERIELDAVNVDRVTEAAAQAVAPLRTFAEELRQAQDDYALGEQMRQEGEVAAAALGTGAQVAVDAARESAMQTLADGENAMIDAEERALAANEAAARRIHAATSLLAGIASTSPPPPVVGRDGTFGDGLVKAAEDVGREVTGTISGLLAHVNVFSGDFGATWSNTWDTVTAAAIHPVEAARAMVTSTVAPIGESFSTGGVDEALGRAPGILAGIVGMKGLTKLEKIRLLRGEDSSPLVPGGGLQRHEDAGGHTLAPDRAHVGADAETLLHRQRNSRNQLSATSSYFDRVAAEWSVHENIAGNREAVDNWLSGNGSTRGFNFYHDRLTGHFLEGGATSSDEARDVLGSRVVLRRDPSMPEGYRVLTSFPTP